MTTRAILFDCFGVLVSCKLPQLFAQYTNQDPQKWQQFQALCESADRGHISSAHYWERVAVLMGLDVARCHQVIDAERHHNYELLEYIKELKEQQFKVGLLSNAGTDIWDYVTPDIQELFDVRIISADLGRCKPDQEVFLEACRQLGVAPEETVLVDDSEANCRGAQQAGLRAVRYRDYTQLRGELSDALVVLA